MAEAELNIHRHWVIAIVVLLLDIAIVFAIIIVDRTNHIDPSTITVPDTSVLIGWIGVLGAIFIFGCYGINIKTPAVTEAKCDCMVFQVYYSVAVAVVSFLIWAIAGSQDGMWFTGSSFCMGLLFGVLWIISQVFGYLAIQNVGYAVGPAVWVGVTITVSFVWGVAVFNTPVNSWPGAIGAIAMLLLGVVLAAGSSVISNQQQQQKENQAREALTQEAPEAPEAKEETEGEGGEEGAGGNKFIFGVLSACGLGLCNGTLMVSLTCFDQGCDSIGVQPYTGTVLAPLAFLPSLAAGILVAQPVLFLLYWGKAMASGNMPQFHFKTVALPGLLTGTYWGMGNFCAMFATVYLGQTIGFPLTQCCLILNGVWGILYFKEIVGAAAIGTFVLASAIILGGATMDGILV